MAAGANYLTFCMKNRKPMTKEDVLNLADLNLAEFVREMARWNASGEILEQNDLLLTKGANRSPATNFAICLNNGKDKSAAGIFDRIKSFYTEKNSGFSLHLRKHADAELEAICQQEKLLLIAEAPGMMIDKPFPDKKMPQGIEIRHVTEISGVVDFAAVTIQSYQSLGLRPKTGAKIFASPDRLLRPHNDIVVAYDQEQPVSAAMVIYSHSIAGIYWVGTVESARGKGMAEACVSAVTNEALKRGAPIVILQASKFGAPVYRRMGFIEFYRLSVVYVF